MHSVVCPLITIFIIVLTARAVMSWFPVRPGTFMAQVNRLLFDLTEWALRPLRQVIPAAGMIDISFLVLVFGLIILQGAVC